MVRITKCPICSKINKIKHKHYNNFVCCSTKFPILQYQINIIPQNNLKELEINENEINDTKDEKVKTYTEEDYNYKCGVCGAYFDEFEGRRCPSCGIELNVE